MMYGNDSLALVRQSAVTMLEILTYILTLAIEEDVGKRKPERKKS